MTEKPDHHAVAGLRFHDGVATYVIRRNQRHASLVREDAPPNRTQLWRFGGFRRIAARLLYGDRRWHAHPRPEIYDRHNQSNAIDFINTIIDKFPFRIREVRTDNGHEFQAQFHWHIEDLGIRHPYINPPRLSSTARSSGHIELTSRSFISS